MDASSPFLPKSESLDGVDSSFAEGSIRESSDRDGGTRAIAIFRRVSTLLLAAWGAFSLCLQLIHIAQPESPLAPDVYRPWTLDKGLNICDCGKTTREALSKNCTYDALAAAWLPPHCRDDELTALFSKTGPGTDGAWAYYADEEGKIPLNESQMADLGETGGSFWAERDWHLLHCLFYWEKYMRLRVTGAVMEARFDNIPHLRHCRHLLMKPKPDHLVLVEVDVVMDSQPWWEKEGAKGPGRHKPGEDHDRL